MTNDVSPIAWPTANLRFFAEHGSWSESVEPNVLDFPVEVGPAKRRRRSYIPSTVVQFQRIISTQELADFLTFFEGSLKSGVFNFTATDPRTAETTEYQFVQVPTWRDVSPGYWRLQFSLRRVNITPATSLFGNDEFTKSLLHLDGVEGQLYFPDSNFGGVMRTWTPGSGAEIVTDDPKFGTGALSLDGTANGYITTPGTADLLVGSLPFSVDTWFKCEAAGGTLRVIAGKTDATGAGAAANRSWVLFRNTTNVLRVIVNVGGVGFDIAGSTQFTSSTNTGWNHAAVVRGASTLFLMVNGVVENSMAISGSVNDFADGPVSIGRNGAESFAAEWLGEIDEFRYSVGVARWEDDFTPAVVPYE